MHRSTAFTLSTTPLQSTLQHKIITIHLTTTMNHPLSHLSPTMRCIGYRKQIHENACFWKMYRVEINGL